MIVQCKILNKQIELLNNHLFLNRTSKGELMETQNLNDMMFKKMKTILILLTLFFLTSCNNNLSQSKTAVLKFEDIKIKPPNCPNYQFESIQKKGDSIVLKINCNETYFFYLTEREYFIYCLKNLKPYLLQEEFIDTIFCEYNYPNQDNRKMDLKTSKQEAIKAIELRDSINAPFFHKIIENVINDSNYNNTVNFMSYIYGKSTIGDSYNFYDDADIFDFYYIINNDILSGNKDPLSLKTLKLMETKMNKTNPISPIDVHITFIKSLYNKGK